MSKIFISYRRNDSATITGRIYDRLANKYARDQIFKDVDSIQPGEVFEEKIKRAIGQSKIMIVVIGPQWMGTMNGENRINQPNDLIRKEIEYALQNKLTIIPLLIDNAAMPPGHMLPDSISRLSAFNAIPIRNDPDFEHDIERLLDTIGRIIPIPTKSQPKPEPTIKQTYTPPVYKYPPPQYAPYTVPAKPVRRATGLRNRGWLIVTMAVVFLCVGSSLIPFIGAAISNTHFLATPSPTGASFTSMKQSVKSALTQCAQIDYAPNDSDTNCPQRESNIGCYQKTITWALHGDPTMNAKIDWDGKQYFLIYGAFVMTESCASSLSSASPPPFTMDEGQYLATVQWSKGSPTVISISPLNFTQDITIPQPSISNSAMLDAMKKFFKSCATQTGIDLAPPCPSFGINRVLINPTSGSYKINSGPTLDSFGYDDRYGVFSIKGHMDMERYQYGNTMEPDDEAAGNYTVYATIDQGAITVIDGNYGLSVIVK